MNSAWFQLALILIAAILGMVLDHQFKRPRINVKMGGYYYEPGHNKQNLILLITNRHIGRRLKILRGEDADNLHATVNLYGKSNLGMEVSFLKLKWLPIEDKFNTQPKKKTKITSGSYGKLILMTYLKDEDGYKIGNTKMLRRYKKESIPLYISNQGNVDERWDISVKMLKHNGIKDFEVQIKKIPRFARRFIPARYGGYSGYLWYLLSGEGKRF